MNFELIEFQSEICKLLNNTYHKNRLSHAYIFEGPKGVGKIDVAHYFSCMLYCKEQTPCFKCSNCMQIIKDEHLNIYLIEPDGKNIKKDQIVGLQEEFSKTSQVEGPRVYIVNDADKMNSNSQNSLLKFIEEPQSEVYGILLTTNASLLLPTITSRCQIIRFKELNHDIIFKRLMQEKVDSKSACLISYLTSDIEEAKKLSKDINMLKCCELFNKFLELKNIREATMFLQSNMSFFESYDNTLMFLDIITILYEDIIHLFYNSLDIKLKEYIEKINQYKQRITKEKAQNDFDLVYSLIRKLNANVSSKNVITNLFVNLF